MSVFYKLEFYVPEEGLEKVKNAIFAAGAGCLGSYDRCCWQTKGLGQFRPLEGSDPYVGEKGITEEVIEYKVEVICPEEKIEQVISALKDAHPYETPAYQYWQVKIQ